MPAKKWDDYMRLEGFKEYYIIEAYQYIPIESERAKIIQEIEDCHSAEECKAIIERARGNHDTTRMEF